MIRGEDVGMSSFGDYHGRVVRQSPKYHPHGLAEVPRSGVGFCAARHPGHRDSVPERAGRAVIRVPPVTI